MDQLIVVYRRSVSNRDIYTRGDVKPRPLSHLSPSSLFVRYAACIVGRKFVALTHTRAYKRRPDSYLSIIDRAPKREELRHLAGKSLFFRRSCGSRKQTVAIPRMDDFVSNNNQSRGNTNLTTGSAAVKNSGEGS